MLLTFSSLYPIYCNILISIISPRGFCATVNLACWEVLFCCNLVSPQGSQLPDYLSPTVTSPWEYQLPVYLAPTITSFFSLRGLSAATLSLIHYILISVSSGISAASLPCICYNFAFLSSGISDASLSLICCKLNSPSSWLLAAILLHSQVLFCCKVACLSQVVWVAHLASIPLPSLSQPFAPLFSCLCSTLNSVSFVSAPSLIFLLLRWFESTCRTALGIHVQQNL